MISGQHVDVNQIFAGGGEMGALMRSTDWSRTALGPVSSWPQTLRTIVSTSLNTRFPTLILWGPHLIKLYNDAYRDLVGSKHPEAMGKPGREVWREIWPAIGPLLEDVMSEGKTIWSEDQRFVLERKGFAEECFFNFAYSPIRDESGAIAGVYVTVAETTAHVLSERRLRTLREVAARTAGVNSADCACRLAASAMADNPTDLPFTLLYVLEGQCARLAAVTGLEAGHPITRKHLDLTDGAGDPLSRADALRTSEAKVIRHVDQLYPGVAARSALVLPIGTPRDQRPLALMVAGVNPGAALDERYASFLELVAAQVATAIASARALEEARRLAKDAQAQLTRSEAKLRQSSALRDEFVTVASHELRTPLTTLGFQADSLLHALRQAGTDDETAERCLPRAEKLRAQATRLEQLIEGMLDVFTLSKDVVSSNREELDLAQVARTIVDRLRTESRQANATINLRTEPSIGTWDRQHLEQIFNQLLSNAVKFGAGQPIDVLIGGTAQAATIVVKDRGIGVAPDAREHIFGRFVRMAPTNQYGGLGLGLWMVRVLAQAMGGSVRVESQPGEGAEFIVELPRNR